MDSRGRPGPNNSGATASASGSMMPYGYSSDGNGYSSRERFWSNAPSDTWSTPGYASQMDLIPYGGNSSPSASSFSPLVGNTNANNSQGSSSTTNPSGGVQQPFTMHNPDMGFPGPSPPNQPISVSSSSFPPIQSPRRTYSSGSNASTSQQPLSSSHGGLNGMNGESPPSRPSNSPGNNNNANFDPTNTWTDSRGLVNGHDKNELDGRGEHSSYMTNHSRLHNLSGSTNRYSDISKDGAQVMSQYPNQGPQYFHHSNYVSYSNFPPTSHSQQTGYNDSFRRPYVDPYGASYGDGRNSQNAEYQDSEPLGMPRSSSSTQSTASALITSASYSASQQDSFVNSDDNLQLLRGLKDNSNSPDNNSSIKSETNNNLEKLGMDSKASLSNSNSPDESKNITDISNANSTFLAGSHPQSPNSNTQQDGEGGGRKDDKRLKVSNGSKSNSSNSISNASNAISNHNNNNNNNNTESGASSEGGDSHDKGIIKKKKKKKSNAVCHSTNDNDLEKSHMDKEQEPSNCVTNKTFIKEELKEDEENRKMSMSDKGSEFFTRNRSQDEEDFGDDGDGSEIIEKDKKDVPMVECGCFPIDEVHSEPGPFYTHLGSAHNLSELRNILESRTGFRGPQLRIEKVVYTGKEGKTKNGCPIGKWILRRGSYEEQLMYLVKHRKGHKCATAWVVISCVIWEAVPPHFADNLYDTLVYKLNRFGIPTTRRSDTNEQRSCACQGVDPDTCGAAYSFGCAWSMFFNGCKYARSRNVRKFRLTEEHEESELEEKVQHLATHLGPLYERVAPDSYKNQVERENEGLECRLGYRPGRPFSGVTACLDYCSHAHKDAHNMMNGCTVTVSFTRNRTLNKAEDEQYHVFPLYKLDDTDEFGSKEGQKQKVKKGQLEILKKFPCKVRLRKVPLLPSRRRGKTKPPSSSSSRDMKSTVSDYSSDISPLKRDKLFDSDAPPIGVTGSSPRLPPGVGGGLLGGGADPPIFDNRFHLGYPSGHQHSFNPPDAGNAGLWNHFGPSSQPAQGSGASSSPFRTYFDPSPFPSSNLHGSTGSIPSQQHSPGSAANFPSSGGSLGGSSSLTSLTDLSNRHLSLSNSSALASVNNNSSNGSSSGAMLSGSSPSSAGGSGSISSGYSSMSPSLPSFRNTFMSDSESASMLSSPSGATSPPDSTSSPRSSVHTNSNHSGKPNGIHDGVPSAQSSPSISSLTSGFGSSGSLIGDSSNPSFPYSSSFHPGQSYSSGTSGANGPPSGGLYHPHAHHPCLPPSSPFGSTSSVLTSSSMSLSSPFGPGGNGSSGFGPPPPSSDSHFNMSPYNHHSGYSNNYSSSSNPYGSYPPPPPGAHSMGMNNSSFNRINPMNQFSAYSHHHGNISNQMRDSWGAPPISPFAPNLNAMSHHTSHSAPPAPPPCFVTPPKPKVIPEVDESYSDNEDCFKDNQMGGVAIALTHGSVVIQCAKHEMHATTSLKNPNRLYPSRICLILYQHKSMNNRFHGWSEWEKKIEAKKLQEVKLINQGKMEASPRKMKQLIKEGYLTDTS